MSNKCVCGHIQQEGGIAWVPDGGIHSVPIHYGSCSSDYSKKAMTLIEFTLMIGVVVIIAALVLASIIKSQKIENSIPKGSIVELKLNKVKGMIVDFSPYEEKYKIRLPYSQEQVIEKHGLISQRSHVKNKVLGTLWMERYEFIVIEEEEQK